MDIKEGDKRMTEEEINKKAEKHCNEVLCNAHEKCNEFIKCRDWRSRRAGFFCGYEQALKDFEKENAELKLKLEALEGQTPWKDIKDKSELIKENAELNFKLKQAVKILKKCAAYEDLTCYSDILEEIETFLKSVDKIKL